MTTTPDQPGQPSEQDQPQPQPVPSTGQPYRDDDPDHEEPEQDTGPQPIVGDEDEPDTTSGRR